MAHNQHHPSENVELSKLFTKLWRLDVNKCEPGKDYQLDLQGFVKNASQISGKDWAKRNLFSFVNEAAIFNQKPTYRRFRALLDNYEVETGQKESVTPQEIQENLDFINDIMQTQVMRETHAFLISKKKAPNDEYAFKKLLHDIWFKLYRRVKEETNYDSCGFEHVFIGETRDKTVIGFHNWIQFYLQEKSGNIDYRGYFRRGTGTEENPRLITIQFTWSKGGGKPIGSTFVGTSPEFEIAIYTICRLMNLDEVNVNIDGYKMLLYVHGHSGGIGSAYPRSLE